MKFELFIAKRLIGAKDYKSSISAPIIKIAITAIALGVVMMLIAVATGIGLQEKIRDKIAAFNGHIVIHHLDNNNSNTSERPILLAQPFYPSFTSVTGVSHIQAVAKKYGVIRTEDDFEGIVFKGVGEDYRWDYMEEYLVSGRLPNFNDSIKYSKEIMLSTYTAVRLNFKLNDQVVVYFMGDNAQRKPRLIAFDVVGFYNSGFEEFDKNYILGDLAQIQRLNKWDKNQVGSFEVFVNDFTEIDQVTGEIYQTIDSFLDATSIKQSYASIFEWLSMFDFNIILIIGVIILVSGINMVTALLVLILERTPMIGTLKALGSNDWSIRKLFLYNAAYLIGKGLFWGNLIGIGLLLVQKYTKIIPLPQETYYVAEVPIFINVWIIILINIGTLLLCLLMLLIPSVVVTKISPSRAMRFE